MIESEQCLGPDDIYCPYGATCSDVIPSRQPDGLPLCARAAIVAPWDDALSGGQFWYRLPSWHSVSLVTISGRSDKILVRFKEREPALLISELPKTSLLFRIPNNAGS